MDLTSPRVIKNLLNKHNIKPSKHLGQNFLISKSTIKELINAADINSEDVILEVGPGIGTITVELAKLAKQVIAVEKDKALLPVLKETTQDFSNIEVLHEDILKVSSFKFQASSFKLVGNIPYYLTAPLIRKFLEYPNPPSAIVFMVQKEMAQRICAKPPNMSILAVSVQVYSKPEIITYVSKSSFWPMPKVDSAIIKITPINANMKANQREFFKIVKSGFSNPRKQLGNNLPKELLLKAGIDPKRRAETLSVEEWTRITTCSL